MSKPARAQQGFVAFQLVGMVVLYAMSSTAAQELRDFDPAGWRPLFALLMGLSACAVLLCALVLLAWSLSFATTAIRQSRQRLGLRHGKSAR